jgi:hypothetical protein
MTAAATRARRSAERHNDAMADTFLTDTTALLECTPRVVHALFDGYDDEVGPWKAYLGILLRRDRTEQ